MSVKFLKYLEEKTDNEIKQFSGNIEWLENLNPLYAHIKISQILHEIIPLLEKIENKEV